MATRGFDDWLNDSDALLWTIEKDPILRSTIVAVGLLDRPPDEAVARQGITRALAAIPRLRQTVEVPPLRVGPPRWVTSPAFDLDYHVRWLRLPDHASQDVLDIAARAAMDAFDRNRPLWELTVLEGLPRNRAAFVLKVHHSLTDGVGGIQMAAHVFDFERRPKRRPPADAPLPAEHLRRRDLAVESWREGTRKATDWTVSRGRGAVGLLGRAVGDPAGAAGTVLGTAQTAVKLLRPVTTPLSPIMVRRSINRDFRIVEVPLDDLKRAGHAAGGTLNDAYLAAVTGALYRYHQHFGAPVDELRVTMPVNLRGHDDAAAGNQFTPARFPLPVSIADPAERLRAVGRPAREWAQDPALAISDDLAALLNRLPTTVTTEVFGSLLKSVDFVATNVPGSPVPLYFGGAKVERLYPFAPPSGSSVAFGLLSHLDTCCVGITIDTAAVTDPALLTACTKEAFAEVLALAGDDG